MITENFLEKLMLEMLTIHQNPYILIFGWMVVMDFVTGYSKSFIGNVANSTKGLQGLIKHLLVVVLVLSVCPLLAVLGFRPIATSFILFYIATYGISIIENLGQAGVPLPDFVSKYFDKLNRQHTEIDINNVKMTIDKAHLQQRNEDE
ncbi:phage holin family protein [Globicatella sp. PHS-GS-PNBC-21-1553]|uniref:phage holin family protein n=1 Tax=Globicatella sp. PHS-GS-PNBC-21-1553 TaxID=2885764 RepID=UPI00298EF2DC|nr:phage holin family protein [Globicatella sp. PHS-GS-PNBC-21-1553]WPC08753.1 phage holin family protein [Globicatella sp. PHS-GS-PNBC-21-1553]